MKATEQYFNVVLFIMLYKMALTFESVYEQYFPVVQFIMLVFYAVVQFIMLYKVVLTAKSVDEILKYDHSNESTCKQNFLMMKFDFEVFRMFSLSFSFVNTSSLALKM